VYPMDILEYMNRKDAGLRVRVEKELRQEFIEQCRSEGRVAAQVLREYMREYVARNRAAQQRDLFAVNARSPP
jgi:hypothetical protein